MTTEPTLSRDAMEAHLTLQGWVPVSYGSAGARRGCEIVYVYRENGLRGEIKHAAVKHGADVDATRWDVDSWFFSDPLFARLVRAIAERDGL